MRFKVDENLPEDVAELLRNHGYDAVTVREQDMHGSSDELIAALCRIEKRVIITLDLDFADIRAYPPKDYSGLIVFRLSCQDKISVLSALRQIVPLLKKEPLECHLWIVEEGRIRIREG
ncbi:MAG: DUF5615 family PIN-like protein [Candidatus Hatepunaea meridiana]|nr:DUF5615 family PIN-like protein [Candidatus Hatepunaea meridiana]